MENVVKNYEIGFLVVNEEDAQDILKSLEAHKAQILKDGKTRKVRLAYPIKKETAAFFGYIQFALESASVKPLSEKLKLNRKVLRYFIINLPDIALKHEKEMSEQPQQPEKESPDMKAKEEEKKVSSDDFVDNELLEKKLQEILK